MFVDYAVWCSSLTNANYIYDTSMPLGSVEYFQLLPLPLPSLSLILSLSWSTLIQKPEGMNSLLTKRRECLLDNNKVCQLVIYIRGRFFREKSYFSHFQRKCEKFTHKSSRIDGLMTDTFVINFPMCSQKNSLKRKMNINGFFMISLSFVSLHLY